MNAHKKKEVLQDFKDALNGVVSCLWLDVVNEIKVGMYAQLDGYSGCEIRVIDGCGSGEDFLTCDLSKLVTNYINYRDGSSSGNVSEAEWCEEIADDLVKQSFRMKKHALKLRSTSFSLNQSAKTGSSSTP